jgi:MFS family permease
VAGAARLYGAAVSALGAPFWTYWSSAVLANLGDGIRLAAFPLLAAQLTDEPALVAVVAAAGGLPWLLTGLLAGSAVDRLGPRWLLPLADLGRLLVLAGLVALLFTDSATITTVAVAAFLLGVGETFRDTAAETVLPRLVQRDQVEQAGGRMTAGAVIGNEFVGPLLGGVLFGAGAVLPFLVNGAVSAFAVLLVLSLPPAVLRLLGVVPVQQRSPATGVRSGLRWLKGQPLVRSVVLVVALVALADSAWFSVFVLYSEQFLDLPPAGFGALLAVGAAGGLVGSLLADRVVAGDRHRAVIAWSAAAATTTPGLLLLVPRMWATVLVVVATSAAFGVLNVAAAGLRYRTVPGELLGRVSAVWRTGAYGASAAGAVMGGAVASGAGLQAPFLLSVVAGLTAISLWLRTDGGAPAAA